MNPLDSHQSQFSQFGPISPVSPISPQNPLSPGAGAASPPVDLGFLPVPSLRAARIARALQAAARVGLLLTFMCAGVGIATLASHLPVLLAIPAAGVAMSFLTLAVIHLHDKNIL